MGFLISTPSTKRPTRAKLIATRWSSYVSIWALCMVDGVIRTSVELFSSIISALHPSLVIYFMITATLSDSCALMCPMFRMRVGVVANIATTAIVRA